MLSSTRVTRDREGNVWVGTAAGLDRFRNRNLRWMELQSGGFGVTLVEADRGDVWAFLEHPPGINLRDRKPLAGLPDWVVRGKGDGRNHLDVGRNGPAADCRKGIAVAVESRATR